MPNPKIELIPGRPAVCSDSAIILNVLIRITPPMTDVHFLRPPLNLSLVLDRSGSMQGASKMPFARQAASFVVGQLLPTDRVSVTIFDESVETIVPNTFAVDRKSIIRRIERIEPRGSTDLHGGWAAGVDQAEANAVPGAINRVLLLSDGQANVGVTDANILAREAARGAARGVSTTTLGLGNDYNEDLMEAMATAGDGHYYYIESPTQLVNLFRAELQGLMATVGQSVSLGLEPAQGVGVSDVLNDFEKVPTGRLKLPNLIVGEPLLAVVMLRIPPQVNAISPLAIRLAYNVPQVRERHILRSQMGVLSPIPLDRWNACPVDPFAAESEALLLAARAQKEASSAIERGDDNGSRQCLVQARQHVQSVPGTPATSAELAAIDEIQGSLERGERLKMQKQAKYRAYGRGYSRPEPPVDPNPSGT